MGSIKRRVERLETHAGEELPVLWSPHQWTLDEQLEDVQGYLDFHQRFKTIAVCTDREINLLGLAAAYRELEGEAGEWEAPYGGVISLEETATVHLGCIYPRTSPSRTSPKVCASTSREWTPSDKRSAIDGSTNTIGGGGVIPNS